MAVQLAYEEVLKDLREIVAEKGGGYIYSGSANGDGTGCMYFEVDGTPSCIVGHVLARKGLSLDDLGSGNEVNICILLDAQLPVVEADERTTGLLEAVQAHQDGGMPWGEALRRAIERVERLHV